MYRCIRLKKPIKQKLLNGNTIEYNSIIVSDSNGYTEVNVSRNGGIAQYNEIALTSRDLDKQAPEGYVAIRPDMKTVGEVLPKLVQQGILKPHPENKSIQISFVEAPLYKLSIAPEPIKTIPAPHTLVMG